MTRSFGGSWRTESTPGILFFLTLPSLETFVFVSFFFFLQKLFINEHQNKRKKKLFGFILHGETTWSPEASLSLVRSPSSFTASSLSTHTGVRTGHSEPRGWAAGPAGRQLRRRLRARDAAPREGRSRPLHAARPSERAALSGAQTPLPGAGALGCRPPAC